MPIVLISKKEQKKSPFKLDVRQLFFASVYFFITNDVPDYKIGLRKTSDLARF